MQELKQQGAPLAWDEARASALYRAGKTDREIADAVGIGRRVVTSWRHRHNWPANTGGRGARNRVDYDELRRLYDMGLSENEILCRMKISRGSITNWRAKNKLPPCGKGKQTPAISPVPLKPKGQKMFMSDAEIQRSMRRCDDRNAQVQILADLNACSRSEMLKHLESIGVDTTGLSRRRRSGKIDDEQALELWKSGAADAVMARSLGVTKQAVVEWRQRFDLPANRAKGAANEIPKSG